MDRQTHAHHNTLLPYWGYGIETNLTRMRRDDRAGTPLQDDLQAVHVPMLLAAPHEVQTRPATEMHLAQYHQQYNTHTHTPI